MRLQEHDYGFYQYEPFLNYLSHGKNTSIKRKSKEEMEGNEAEDEREEKSEIIELDDLTEDHPFLKPIFRQRSQLLIYDAIVTLKAAILPALEELKIKKTHILGTIGLKLAKLFISFFTRERFDFKTDVGSDTRIRLLQTIEVLCEPLKYYQSQSVLPWGIRRSDVDS